MEGHTESLAGTGKGYIIAQARVFSSKPPVLNVQIPGLAGGNRTYGAACRVNVSEACAAFVEQYQSAPSLAETSRKYTAVQIRSRGKDRLNLQIEGSAGNRDYGFAEEVTCPSDVSMLLAAVQDAIPEPSPVMAPLMKTAGLQIADLGGLVLEGLYGFLTVTDGGVTLFIPDTSADDLIRR